MKDRYIKIENVKCFYTKTGKGPPLLFIHGHRADAFRWRGFLEKLSENHEVFAPDLPGHGRSTDLPFKPTMKNYALFLKKFMDQAGIQDHKIFGASMGGIIAVNWALESEKDINKLILFGTPLSHKFYKLNSFQITFLKKLTAKLSKGGFLSKGFEKVVGSNTLFRPILKFFLLDEKGEETKMDYEMNRWRSQSMKVWAQTFLENLTVDFTTTETVIKTPTILIQPRNDAYINVKENNKGAKKLFKNFEICLVNSPGHLPHGPITEEYLKAFRKSFSKI